MTKYYLIPSLITASVIGLSACDGGTSTSIGDNPTNTDPVANISGDVDEQFELNKSYTLSAADSTDKEDDSLSIFSWSGDSVADDENSETLTIIPTETGNYEITLTVTDSGGNSNSDTFSFTIGDGTNTPPVAKISGDTELNVEVGQSISLSAATSTDKEDGTLSNFAWLSDFITSNKDKESVNITFTEKGPKKVTLTVTDNDDATHSTDITFNVKEGDGNKAPTAKITEVMDSYYVSDPLSFSGEDSSDPEDGAVSSYSWESELWTGKKTNEKLDFELTKSGTYTITLTVTDSEGKTDKEDYTFEVKKQQCLSCNDPVAVINPAGKQTIEVGKTLTLSAADSTGEGISYLWSNSKTTKTIELSFDSIGQESISLTVKDENDVENEISITIDVIAAKPSNTIVYFKNNVNFAIPTTHFWGLSSNITASTWPGETMTDLGNDWFSYDFGAKNVSGGIAFNDNEKNPTDDLVLDPATPCYQNSKFVAMSQCDYQPVDPGDIEAPTVAATPKSGTYATSQSITLKITDNEDTSPKLYFTIDGSTPSNSSTLYNSGDTITVSDSLTIKAFAIDDKGNNEIYNLRYTIGSDPEPTELGENIFAADCSSAYNDYSDNLRIYQVMVEAFIDGDSNVGYGTGYGPSHHNGDLQGIINSLDYIKDMGMNAIWLTPIFDSEGGSQLDATGYFTRNYFEIDPKWGDMAKAKELVDTAHAKGLYVFFDGVFGHHKGNVPQSPNGNSPQGGDNPVDYPGSLAFYTEVATYWVKELKIDGWRLDQAYQVPIDAWRDIRKAVVETSNEVSYTNSEGKTVHPLGYMVGEIWKGEQEIKDTGYGTETNRGLCSNFDFPGRYNLVQTFAGEEHMNDNNKKDLPASNLAGVFTKHEINPSNVHPNLMISNHDILRLGDLLQRGGIAGPNDDEYWQRHKGAFGFMGAYTGPITLYYGDEVGDEVPNDGDFYDDNVARSSGKIEGLGFTANAREKDLRDFVRKLMQIRSQEPALYTGERTHLEVGDDETIYADLKQKSGDSILYITNKSNTAQTVTVSTTQMQATGTLTDLIDDSTVSESSGSYSITLAPWQVRYLKAN